MGGLSLPASCVVKGFLPDSQEPEDLVGDMLEIDLPDGTTIDVGWVPEHEPTGCYRVVVYRDYWDDQVAPPLLTRSRDEVIAAVTAIANKACS